MIIVRAGLDQATRRRAVRDVLAASHRFPALVLYPALADSRIRRMIMEVTDAASSLMQHVASFAGSNPTATAMAAVATVATAGAATVGVMTAVAPALARPAAPGVLLASRRGQAADADSCHPAGPRRYLPRGLRAQLTGHLPGH